MRELIWEKFSELEKINVKSFSYVIDENDDRGNIVMYDDFSKTIVRSANFKNFYNLLREGEDFYRYLVEDLKGKEMFTIEAFLENVNPLPKQKEEINVSDSYADYMVFRLNKYFREVFNDLSKNKTKKLRIVCFVYRVREISQLYNEYAVLEAELLLYVKEVF